MASIDIWCFVTFLFVVSKFWGHFSACKQNIVHYHKLGADIRLYISSTHTSPRRHCLLPFFFFVLFSFTSFFLSFTLGTSSHAGLGSDVVLFLHVALVYRVCSNKAVALIYSRSCWLGVKHQSLALACWHENIHLGSLIATHIHLYFLLPTLGFGSRNLSTSRGTWSAWPNLKVQLSASWQHGAHTCGWIKPRH